MENRKLLSALIGLAGAVSNNGKTDNTDRTVCVALLSQDTNQAVEMVHREKFLISPDCASCQSPCGNTSDYDLSVVEQEEKQIRELKVQVLELLHHVSVRGLS